MEILSFIGGAFCVAFPGAILYLRTREDRNYFERDRDGLHAELEKLRKVIAKCGPVVSEPEVAGDSGGWVKAWLPSMRDMQNAHALLCYRFDLIETATKYQP